jgi:hypothetical protein
VNMAQASQRFACRASYPYLSNLKEVTAARRIDST